MTNLTDKWKKGELINGKKYYITFYDSEPFEATFRAAEAIVPFWKFEANGRQYCDENGYDCIKVLASVPSYGEWDKLNWYAGNGVEENQELKIENTKLKTDCHTLAQKLLQVKPELREWLEANFKEYL